MAPKAILVRNRGAMPLRDSSSANDSVFSLLSPSVAFNGMASSGSCKFSSTELSSGVGVMKNSLRGSLNTVANTDSIAEFSHSSSQFRSETKVLANSFQRRASCLPNSNAITDDLTINKLQFHKVKLVGRDKERKLLEERLQALIANVDLRRSQSNQRTTQNHVGHRELALVSGVSGTGKSALAQTLQDKLQGHQGVFVKGKFDLKASDKPFSTIITACQDLGLKILALQDGMEECFRAIQSKLRRELVGMEQYVLLRVVPVLSAIVTDNDSFDAMEGSGRSQNKIIMPDDSRMQNSSRTAASLGNDQAQLSGQTKELLESAFKKFFRTVSYHLAPLVLCLDDLQWSDVHTLELLKDLLSDSTNPHLMIVACYRSNEVNQTHSLAKVLRDLKQAREAFNIQITEIHIDNLGPKETNEILTVLLNGDNPKKTQDLANLCYERTNGNPFFLLLYVDMLYRSGMLSFDLGVFSWKWDIAQMKTSTVATANVVELMTNKILKCSNELIHLLKLACCLGNVFTGTTLFLVWALSPETIEATSNGSEHKDRIFEQLLEESIQEMFLERCEEGIRWCHDKVQEAAMLLEPEELFGPRRYQVGRTLYTCLEGGELEDSLFCIVDLLNSGTKASSKELAKLNLRVAQKAKVFGALSAQAGYAEMGLGKLPRDCWVNCKKLALDLYTIRAEAASSMGDFGTMETYCNLVFSQEECSVVDKIPCYKVFIHNFARHGKYKEALGLEIAVLEKLGCKLPRGDLSQAMKAVVTLLSFKQNLRKTTPTKGDLLDMPLMIEPVHKHTMSLLASMILHAYVARNKMLWLLGTIRMVQMTLWHGLADQSQLAFSSASVMITHALGDWKMGPHYAHLSLAMYDELPDEERSHRSSTLCASEGLVLAWTKPLKGQLRWLMEGYRSGMELGDVEWAFSNIAVYVETGLLSGMNLSGLSEDIGIYLSQFESMCTNGDYAKRVRMVWQTAMNLIGDSENATFMAGLAFSEEHVRGGDAAISGLYFLVLKSFLCVHFGDHEQGAALAMERGNRVYEGSPGHPMGMPDPFLRAMSLYAMTGKTGKLNYKRHANKARKTVKAWLRKGNPNACHQLELLNAERAAVSKSKETSNFYYKAARLAIRGGFIHDAALASERHAEYLLEQRDTEGATAKLKEAMERYSSWGALRKADQLRTMYSDLLGGDGKCAVT